MSERSGSELKSKVQVSYDPEANAAIINLDSTEEKVSMTESKNNPYINLDLDAQGDVVGLEITSISNDLSPEALDVLKYLAEKLPWDKLDDNN